MLVSVKIKFTKRRELDVEEYMCFIMSNLQYFIGSWRRLNEQRNQDLVELLVSNNAPVYVQLGLNPNYFQFYTPLAEDPIKAGYDRPSYAGVLTGYNFTQEDLEYWKVYIRRHTPPSGSASEGLNYNYVKVAAVFKKNGIEVNPFAGITSMAINIVVTEADRDRGLVEGTVAQMNLIDKLDSVQSEADLIAVVEQIITDSQDPSYAPRDQIIAVILDPDVLYNNGIGDTLPGISILDVFPKLESITVPDTAVDNAYLVFTDFWDIAEISFVSSDSSSGRRLEDPVTLTDLTITGKMTKLTFGANTMQQRNLRVHGKRKGNQ